ncbi:MAG: hypothetical protein GY822_14370 [Deltaproteobacteria bacterium]|nr:hypothetical protein [Deltaproteobacteria bacterium]
MIRRFKGGQAYGISPLVQGVPKNPYGQNWDCYAEFKAKVRVMEEPTGKWDGNIYLAGQHNREGAQGFKKVLQSRS